MSTNEKGKAQSFVSLEMTNRLVPDHDYPSTADNLWHYGADHAVPCFTVDTVPVAEVDPSQLLDDPDAHESEAKIESIRETIRQGEALPPVYVLHTQKKQHEYYLFEGMHRYNASHREDVQILAWVAHLGCCGGPIAVSRQGSGSADG